MDIRYLNFVFLGLAIIFLNCSQYKSKPETDIEVKRITDQDSRGSRNPILIEYRITNNDFALHPFPVMPTPKNIHQVFKLKFQLKKVPFNNVHSNAIDTIYRFSYGKSTINFYKSATKSLLQDAVIADAEIKLSKEVAVGISKEDFLRKFNVTDKVKDDIILITDEEEFYSHKITFEKDMISSITLRMGVD
jgi:hypothetical protein